MPCRSGARQVRRVLLADGLLLGPGAHARGSGAPSNCVGGASAHANQTAPLTSVCGTGARIASAFCGVTGKGGGFAVGLMESRRAPAPAWASVSSCRRSNATQARPAVRPMGRLVGPGKNGGWIARSVNWGKPTATATSVTAWPPQVRSRRELLAPVRPRVNQPAPLPFRGQRAVDRAVRLRVGPPLAAPRPGRTSRPAARVRT